MVTRDVWSIVVFGGGRRVLILLLPVIGKAKPSAKAAAHYVLVYSHFRRDSILHGQRAVVKSLAACPTYVRGYVRAFRARQNGPSSPEFGCKPAGPRCNRGNRGTLPACLH